MAPIISKCPSSSVPTASVKRHPLPKVSLEVAHFPLYYDITLNEQAVVLLTYPKEAFGVCTALKVFLCSDLSLSDEEVLEHYSHRWKIEVMFKQQKQYLGLKSFMIRSAKAIDRFLIILTLAWFWFTRKTELLLPFSVGIRRYRGLLSIF